MQVINLKGFLFKYDAGPFDQEMKDNPSVCGAGICGIMDPDFISNCSPVWGICGPYVRTSLEKGDMVFFLPKKRSIQRAGSRARARPPPGMPSAG